MLNHDIIGFEEYPSSYKVSLSSLARHNQVIHGVMNYSSVKLTPLEKLNVCTPANIELSSHLHVCKYYKSIISKNLRQEFTHFFEPMYQLASHGLDYLDCRYSNYQSRLLKEYILNAIINSNPLSLIRIGDGESYAWLEQLSPQDIALRERAWWRDRLSTSERIKISTQLRESISNATILGIPSCYRLARDTTEGQQSYKDNDATYPLLHIAKGVLSLQISAVAFTEERIHQLIFNTDTIRLYVKHSQKVLFVTSIKPEELNGLFNHCSDKITHITIPTHTKMIGLESYESTDISLPFVYEDIIHQINNVVLPGTLVIIGAGVLGKIFCHKVLLKGGIAIDVGSMVDYWLGYRTRSIKDQL
ncbi:GT-D fold domain-containing protein [Woodsholea maritima]|uniref:GT-D fold domain-containing protein n=1 Tax=Woodsholea maritima TaxID=240237 RepID=UPI0003A7115C|nr:hypothetical protein [Woodsholea maritima]